MKHKLIKGTILLSLIALLVVGCTGWLDNEFIPLPSYQWPEYSKGDTFVYKSIVTGDLDTFVVSEFIMDTAFNGNVDFERTEALFVKLVQDTADNETFYVSNDSEGALFAWDSIYVYLTRSIQSIDTTLQDFHYTGLQYAFSERSDTVSEKLFRIYFDFHYGLVKYTSNNMDSYELFRRP